MSYDCIAVKAEGHPLDARRRPSQNSVMRAAFERTVARSKEKFPGSKNYVLYDKEFHVPEIDFHIMKKTLCMAPDFDFINRNFISYRNMRIVSY
jgi:hypothetical protein